MGHIPWPDNVKVGLGFMLLLIGGWKLLALRHLLPAQYC
jgi:hypothetical protein